MKDPSKSLYYGDAIHKLRKPDFQLLLVCDTIKIYLDPCSVTENILLYPRKEEKSDLLPLEKPLSLCSKLNTFK